MNNPTKHEPGAARPAPTLAWILLASLFTAGCVSTAGDVPAGEVPWETVEHGGASGIGGGLQLVVRDEATWRRLWNDHQSIHAPPEPVPHVDFAKHMVIAVFRGETSSSCHDAAILRILDRGDHLEVQGEWTDIEGAVCAQVMTFPYHIVKLGASDKLVEFAFAHTVQHLG